MTPLERGGGGLGGGIQFSNVFAYSKHAPIFLIVAKFNGCLLNDHIFFIKRPTLTPGPWPLYQDFNNFDFSFQTHSN